MSKSTDGDSEAAKKKKAAAAKKAPAKKPPAKSAKAPAKKAPAKKPAAKSAKPMVQQELPDVVEAPETIKISVETRLAEDAEVIAETVAPVVEEDVPELTEEERELSAVYGEEMAAPAAAHAEYKDGKTADEDRPMMPEINARQERKAQWQDRRENRRRSRRDDRGPQRNDSGNNGNGNNGGNRNDNRPRPPGGSHQSQQGQNAHSNQSNQNNQNAHGERPVQQFNGGNGNSGPRVEQRPVQPPVQIEAVASDPLARVGTPLGDAAATVFAQLRNGQPLPVRQLAAMMRKRNLVESDPDQLAPQLKAELLGDERSYRTLGLRPRIVYRGRDLFAPGPVSMSQTADAEAGIATALSRLAGATHRALAARMLRATPAGFERLIHAYLVAAGYREILWVKRIDGISYAQATAPGIERMVLISARSGDTPIDRRGIGELRVGVEAKNLVAGMLFSAPELSEDAERELERSGRSIHVMCGDQLIAALISAGVGVVSAAAPLHYVDDQLLDELLAG